MSLETSLSLKDQSILCMPFSNTSHIDPAFLQESVYYLNTDLYNGYTHAPRSLQIL